MLVLDGECDFFFLFSMSNADWKRKWETPSGAFRGKISKVSESFQQTVNVDQWHVEKKQLDYAFLLKCNPSGL